MLDFRVYTFLAVCEYMNYTRAAEALPPCHSIYGIWRTCTR